MKFNTKAMLRLQCVRLGQYNCHVLAKDPATRVHHSDEHISTKKYSFCCFIVSCMLCWLPEKVQCYKGCYNPIPLLVANIHAKEE